MDLKPNGYDEARGRAFFSDLLDSLRADARRRVGDAGRHPSDDAASIPGRSAVAIEGYEPRRDEDLTFLSNVVAPDYFRTLRIRLIAGREFEDRDDETAAPVAIVNETLPRRFWGGAANAIGKRVRVASGDWRTVVGVAARREVLAHQRRRRGRTSTCRFCSRIGPAMMLHARGPPAVDDAHRAGPRAHRALDRRPADLLRRTAARADHWRR